MTSKEPPAEQSGMPDARAQLQTHFSTPAAQHGKQWSKLWDAGDFLPWDRGIPNPALTETLAGLQNLIGGCFSETGRGPIRRKKALVPGCGRGYDVLLLASFGYDAYGLEVSETAVKRCLEEQQIHAEKYPARNEEAGVGSVMFVAGDFFSDSWIEALEGTDTFDLIYDYTVTLFSHSVFS